MGKIDKIKHFIEKRVLMKKILLVLTCLTALLLILSILRSDTLAHVTDEFLLVVIVILVVCLCVRVISLSHGMYSIRRRFGLHGVDSLTEVIEDCRPVHRTFSKKKKHAVILLHGFVSTPQVFDSLLQEMEECEIDYYAPLINGFGIKRVQLVFSFSENDWVRQLTELYDVLATQYENISVLGHSMGGALALYLAQARPVKRLVLLAPAVFPGETQRVQRYFSRSSVVSKIIAWIIPLMPLLDTRRPNAGPDGESRNYILYPVAPTQGVFNLLRMQARIRLEDLQYETMDLIYGVNDAAVDGEEVHKSLTLGKRYHRLHRLDYTGHNPLTEGESDYVALIIGLILRDQLAWPPQAQDDFR